MAPASDLVRQADALLGQRRLDEAAALYGQALALDPAHPVAWFNLGWTLRALRRFDAALAAYGEALARGIDRPEDVRLNRAVILSDHLFRPDDAIEELTRALAAAPGDVRAWLALGLIHEDQGDAAAARAAYEHALALAPGNGRATARLGALAIAGDDAATAARQLTAALDGAVGPTDRAEMLFTLGDALDRLGRYDEAFPAYDAANTIARQLARFRYDPAAQAALVDRLIATPLAPGPADPVDPQPIFICGMFRSGSTLAERILSRHSEVAAGGELEFVPTLVAGLAGYPETAPSLTDGQLTTWRAEYRRDLPAGRFVTDKRCDNILHLGLIARLFPAARVVHTRRTPLDNLLSVYCLHFDEGVTYGHDLADAAHYYIQYRRLLRHLQDAGLVTHDLDYDALVRAPQPTLAALLGSLDLAWEDGVLASQVDAAPVRTASAWQVRAALHDRSSGRWRHYERQMAAPRRLLADAGFAS